MASEEQTEEQAEEPLREVLDQQAVAGFEQLLNVRQQSIGIMMHCLDRITSMIEEARDEEPFDEMKTLKRAVGIAQKLANMARREMNELQKMMAEAGQEPKALELAPELLTAMEAAAGRVKPEEYEGGDAD